MLLLLLGILALVLGSRLMVEGAVNLARLLGISELVIAVTLVAFGTSLPELAASLSAAYPRPNGFGDRQCRRLEYRQSPC